jgi:flagellar basal-body rod protein FlgB
MANGQIQQVSRVSPSIYSLEKPEAFHNLSTSGSKALSADDSHDRKQRCCMFANLTSGLDFHSKALVLRAERQRILASNIANADTPGYVARDFKFKDTLEQLTNTRGGELSQSGRGLTLSGSNAASHPRHLDLPGTTDSSLSGGNALGYAVQSQPSVDGNSVDLDRERANFVDNSVRYESTLRFINGTSKTILSAIQGQ